ncbi:TBC1 domain family member 30-like [Limulus polyphemus]|uniref:TBC1 domain family member 30-like n=1 Tax=Limulus polyphemus TaxID=6850 RepID=A0ABM1BZ02_LIMPO|nr:TBC1 domain family member 30-like [Limulus polyphemus]
MDSNLKMTSVSSTFKVPTTTKDLSDIPLTPPSSPEILDCRNDVEPEFVDNFQNIRLPLEDTTSEESTLQTWEYHSSQQDDSSTRYVQQSPSRTLEAKPPIPEAMTLNKKRTASIVDGLLVEIYNRRYSVDSDNLTDSSVSDVFAAPPNLASDCESHHRAWYSTTTLNLKGAQELILIKSHLLERVQQLNNRLVCRLKLRDHLQNKRNRKYDVITAILQAVSQKRRIDTRIRFSLEPLPGETGFSQWHDAMKMVVRLSVGIPSYFRKRVMIFLIENVLPPGYFADNLRGLSVDMAVFRELLDTRVTKLSRHLENLQLQARDCSTGTNYEPPLTNVFTMQWFLTLFSTCLPKSTVLKVWDLVFLEGNEVLLKTALAIWEGLSHEVLNVETADEFYSTMGHLSREMLEFGLMDPGELIQKICTMEPFFQLAELRDKYNYNVYPLLPQHTCDSDNDDGGLSTNREWCLSSFLNVTSIKGTSSKTLEVYPSRSAASDGSPVMSFSNTHVERTSLDISALKRQYIKLCERQRQAHIILTGDFRESAKPKQKTSVAMNHLLLKRKPLVRKYKNGMQTRFILKTPNCSKNCVQQLVPEASLSGANMLIRIPRETEKYEMKKRSLVEECKYKQYSDNLPREVKEKLEALESTVDFLDVRQSESEDDSDNSVVSTSPNIFK